MREDIIGKMFKEEIGETDGEWVKYEDYEAQTKFDVADQVLDWLVEEMADLLQQM